MIKDYGQNETPGSQNERKAVDSTYKTLKRNNLLTYLISALIIAGVLIFGSPNTGSIQVQLGDEYLGVAGADGKSIFVFYNDIVSIERRAQIDKGSSSTAIDNEHIWSGLYINDEFGEFTLDAYANVSDFIVITHKDGVLIINSNTLEATDKLYADLQAKITG
jgi:hypothetical protein